VAQGGVFLAGLSGAGVTSAVVEFAGRQVRAVAEADTWLAIVPTGQVIGETEQLPSGRYPLRLRYEQTGRSGPNDLTGTVTVSPTDFPVEAITLEPGVASLLDPDLVDQELVVIREVYATFTPRRLWDGFFVRPNPAGLTDVYGSRRSYNGGPATGSHSGVDFGAFTGQPALAAARGRVVLARPLPVRGNMVILDHGAGVLTGYCHLSAFAVDVGQEVAAGQRIGSVGATGLVTGPHLHWEVVAGGRQVDGLRWLHP
jgi:murein DD-endopeptidase MepM/ murein hydrolase activator NlpD